MKKQVKWKRYGDVNSWRREYDLYQSGLHEEFLNDFSWPACYFAELKGDSFEIWMDYIEGSTGTSLTIGMYQKAAFSLGRFQGKLYQNHPNTIQKITNLSTVDYVKKFYEHYRSWGEVYNYIRSVQCELSNHLCEMMIHFDARSNEVFKKLDMLPIVLCHRDYRSTNIFNTGDHIYAIDWDTAGFGYFGEDIASLIAEETDPAKMKDYFQACIPAYKKRFFGICKYE